MASFPAPIANSDSSATGKPSKWSSVRTAVQMSAMTKDKNKVTQADTLAVSSASSSASAAFARSLVLFTGFLFRRPSKLFKPNRVDTWMGLRQLALSTEQAFSHAFLRSLLKQRAGLITVILTIIPPMLVNATLGFLLFTSHSLFSLGLARLPFFQRKFEDGEQGEEELNLETLVRGPTIIPNHPTILSAIAGAGAGVVQGAAFTPVENVVRFVHQSTTSWATILARLVHLPVPSVPAAFDASQPATPAQAIKNLFSSDSWKKNRNWWTGWQWAICRDALSYSCFFAAFDVTRRVGLRVKALFGGDVQGDWDNFLVLDFPSTHTSPSPSSSSSSSISSNSSASHIGHTSPSTYRPMSTDPTSPTVARVAQAITIVTGGVLASVLADMVGRPFRACQRIMMIDERARVRGEKAQVQLQGQGQPRPRLNPILETLRTKGVSPFIRREGPVHSPHAQGVREKEGRMRRVVKRVGWRMAAVGPWGFGFLVWAWVGGEV